MPLDAVIGVGMLRAGMNANDDQRSLRQVVATMNRHSGTVCTLRLLSVLVLLALPILGCGQSYTNNYGIWTYYSVIWIVYTFAVC